MRCRPAAIALVCLLARGPTTGLVFAADPPGARVPATRDTEPSLETRLKNGLRPRLPSETRYVAAVVDHVHAGKLPQKLVDSTYLWALHRDRRHPFASFEKALRIQAARLGVSF